MRVHLNVAGQNMTKHIRQLCVRPFILVLLLEFLIDRQHTALRGKGSPAEVKTKMRDIVAEEYPEREPNVPYSEREAYVPEGILTTMREMEEEQREGELDSVGVECVSTRVPATRRPAERSKGSTAPKVDAYGFRGTDARVA